MHKKTKVQLTSYRVYSAKIQPKKILIAADLHSESTNLPDIVRETKPDCCFLVGDILDSLQDSLLWKPVLTDIEQIANTIPVYISMGNHEVDYVGIFSAGIIFRKTGAIVLNNTCSIYRDLLIYGYTPDTVPEPIQTDELERTIVLCHRPNDYFRWFRPNPPFLTVAGHVHGGQWRIGNQGIYAPDQGLFPKYTSGFYENKKLLVTRGIGNAVWIPRIRNKPEAILLSVQAPDSDATKSG